MAPRRRRPNVAPETAATRLEVVSFSRGREKGLLRRRQCHANSRRQTGSSVVQLQISVYAQRLLSPGGRELKRGGSPSCSKNLSRRCCMRRGVPLIVSFSRAGEKGLSRRRQCYAARPRRTGAKGFSLDVVPAVTVYPKRPTVQPHLGAYTKRLLSPGGREPKRGGKPKLQRGLVHRASDTCSGRTSEASPASTTVSGCCSRHWPRGIGARLSMNGMKSP